MRPTEIPQSRLSRLLFMNTSLAWFWLLVRVYLGYEWLMAGWGKVGSPAWTGSEAGKAITGFLNSALQKTAGEHPDVSWWYASFIQSISLPNSTIFSYLVTYGEVLVGIALILGAFTGVAAFFATFMNFNYLFAGTVSTNPIMILLQIFLILAWRTSGWIGLDRYILPKIGNPWQLDWLFNKKK
jgi:thiosulfate dehydrogenase [quinone] large subunit